MKRYEYYEEVSEDIFRSLGRIKMFDRTVILPMKNGNIAKLVLSTRAKSGEFRGYKLAIINPKAGVIDGKFFDFQLYINCDGEREYFIKESNSRAGKKLYWADTDPTDKSLAEYAKKIVTYINSLDV